MLRRLLSAEYNRRSLLKPLFWLNTIKLALDDVYTRLSIVSRRKTDFVLEGNEVDMFNIFRTLNKGEDAMVLVEGSPGIGKTTFCLKISHDWAKGTIPNESSFPLFELVLLLKCRDFHGNVMEAIVNQLLPEDMDQNAKKNVVHYIKDIHNQERILIILDGLDELPETAESSVDKLLHRRILPFCYVLATSRQEKGIEVRQNVDFDVLLQIKGFTEVDSYDYIRKHFRHLGHDYEPKGGWLIKAIQDNSYLHELPSNPLNLLLLCVVFEEYEGNLPSCRTDLYQIIVLCLLRRYCARHNDEDVTAGTAGAAGYAGAGSDKALMRHFEDSLLVLGELAWRCLEEGRFSFREKKLVEFESTHESLAARKLGLVFKEASLRKINPQHEYFFFHKTFQEYLAAFYLAYRLLKRKIDFFSELNLSLCNDMMVRYRQVFIFMSGILGEEAGLLFEQIGKKLKDVSWDWDWDWCKKEWASFFHDCFSESRNYEKVAMALCSFISFPQTITIDLSKRDRSTELFVILNACTSFSQLQLPVHLAIKSSKSMVLADVNNDLLADFVAFNTRLQTLSFSVLVMTEEISTLLCRVLRVDSTAYSFTLEVTCSNISSVEFVAISDSLAANKTLTTVTFQLPCKILEDYVAILDKGLSADTPLTSIVLKTFGPWTETEAELLRKILLNRSLTSQSLAVGGKMHDSLATSVSEGLVANSSLKSLALIFCGKLSHSGLSLLKEGFLGNRSLESLQLKVFGELPTNWANICGTLQSAIKSTTSFTVYPDITGMVGNSQVAFLCPVLKENISASKLHSVTVNIWGELDCSGATDLCKLLIASSASCVNLNMNGRITDSVADCLFRHFNKLDTLSYLSIDIRGEVMGDGKKTLQRLSSDQIYFFAFNVHSFNSGNKICREVCLSTDDSSPITPVFAKVKDGCVTKLNVSINNPGSISEDWKCNLFEGLAKNECVTTLNLVFNNLYLTERLDALWDAVGENATLTTLSLTVNDYYGFNIRWIWDMVGGLAKNTSLTTLSFTVDNYDRSITNWTWGLVGGLAKNTSLTTLSFTVNNYHEMTKEWTWGLDDALVKNTSLTMLSLTVNNYSTLVGEWTCGLGEGVGKNTSLTTLNLTVNNYYYMRREWTHDLCHAMAKNRSLTTLSLTVNNYGTFDGDWTCDLGDGLANNTSLTMLSLTVNNYSRLVGRWACGLVKGLVKNVSLTTLSLTVNNYSEMSEMSEKWTLSLYDGLAKNTSLVTLNLTFSNWNNLYEDWIHGLVDALVTNASLAAISLEVNIFAEGNKNSKSILA